MKIKITKHSNGFYKIKINNIIGLYTDCDYTVRLNNKYYWISGGMCDYISPSSLLIIYNKYNLIIERQIISDYKSDIILDKLFSWIKDEDNQNVMKNLILEFEKNIYKQIQKKEKDLEILNKFKEKFGPVSLEKELSLIKESESILDILS